VQLVGHIEAFALAVVLILVPVVDISVRYHWERAGTSFVPVNLLICRIRTFVKLTHWILVVDLAPKG
jgi:hypothetical protein